MLYNEAQEHPKRMFLCATSQKAKRLRRFRRCATSQNARAVSQAGMLAWPVDERRVTQAILPEGEAFAKVPGALI